MKSLSKLKIVYVTLLMVVFVAIWGWRSWSPYGILVSGDGYTGVICTSGSSPWIPTEKTILSMEADFRVYLKTDEPIQGSRLSIEPENFWRQYMGGMNDGNRFILISFLHKAKISRRTFLNGVIVAGGGDCYWFAKYYVEKRTFIRVLPNAPM